jgi:hypothetical protein
LPGGKISQKKKKVLEEESKMRRVGKLFLIGLVLCCIIPAVCQYSFADSPATLLATFDSFPEGYSARTFVDGGITLYDLHYYNEEGFNPTFSVESIGSQYNLGSAFTRPNCLSTFGYGPGPGYGYTQLNSAKITCGEVATAGGIDIFSYPSRTETNMLKLQAIFNGTVVATNTMVFNDGLGYHRLAVSGVTFDYLQLVSSGPSYGGSVYVLMDNVSITPVPEPATLLLLTLGGLALRRKR